MQLDILILAGIAAVIFYRLYAVLGTRHGDEKQRPNPFAVQEDNIGPATEDATGDKNGVIDMPVAAAFAVDADLIDAAGNVDGRIETGLAEIAAADPSFRADTFVQGARMAFEMIAMAYARGDIDTLQSLLSPKLYGDFKAGIDQRQKEGHIQELVIHRIKKAQIVAAHLGGTMAYVTVSFAVEETGITRDSAGNTVDGNADTIVTVEDIWTFTRDTRSPDPNWVLIETRAA